MAGDHHDASVRIHRNQRRHEPEAWLTGKAQVDDGVLRRTVVSLPQGLFFGQAKRLHVPREEKSRLEPAFF